LNIKNTRTYDIVYSGLDFGTSTQMLNWLMHVFIGRLNMFYLTINHIDGIMISVLASNATGRGFELRSVQSKDYSIDICH